MPASRRACGACSAELLRDLADVPSLAHHVELTLTRQARVGSGNGPAGTETPLPWDERAREAGFVLRSALVGWVRVLGEDVQPLEGPTCDRVCDHSSCAYLSLGRGPVDELAAIARWLVRHSGPLLRHPAAVEAVEEISGAVRQARRVIDRPPDRVYAGACDECEADMYARPGAETVTCPVCVDGQGRRLLYDVRDRRAWMLAAVEDMELPAPDIARALTTLIHPIAPALLHTWVARGKLSPVPTVKGPVCAPRCPHDSCEQIRAGERPRFRTRDVVDLMIASSRQKAS